MRSSNEAPVSREWACIYLLITLSHILKPLTLLIFRGCWGTDRENRRTWNIFYRLGPLKADGICPGLLCKPVWRSCYTDDEVTPKQRQYF
jgi:hypothetical protein